MIRTLILLTLLLLTACRTMVARPQRSPEAVAPPPTPVPAPTVPPTQPPTPTTPPPPASATPPPAPTAPLSRFPSPDGQWTALLDETAGSLKLLNEGQVWSIFDADSAIGSVSWSPDGQRLLIVQRNWRRGPDGIPQPRDEPLTVWRVTLDGQRPGSLERLFQSPTEEIGPEQLQFGTWSPNNRHVLIWLGILSASILADGLTPFVLDTDTGQAAQVADFALLAPSYHSWSPDSSALVLSAGAGREVWRNKSLVLYDVEDNQATTVVSQTERIPGQMVWSPQGDVIAYAASPAEFSDKYEGGMTFDNPGIAGRRIWLLDPDTGQSERLNEVDAFQDAPRWSDDGRTLFYVQRDGEEMALMARTMADGQTEVIARQPAPDHVGYYGLERWEELLAHRDNVSQKAGETTPDSTRTEPGSRYLYAEKFDEAFWQNRSVPIYQIYAEVPETGQQTPLFTVGGVGAFPAEFHLLPNRNALLVNLETRLDLFDLTTGQAETLLTVDPDRDMILDMAVSADGSQVAATWARGVYHAAEESFYELWLIDPETGQSQRLLRNPVDMISLTPRAWNEAGTVLFLYEHIPAGIIGPLWRIDADGRTLTQLDVSAAGRVAPSGEWVAVAENNGVEPDFLCFANDQNRLRLYAPFANDSSIIFNEDQRHVTVRDWSPQSDAFIYEVKRPLSGTGCETEFGPPQIFRYDIATRQSQPIASIETQLEDWNLEPPTIEQRLTTTAGLIYLGRIDLSE